jgi:L-fucose isomerase
VPHIGVMTVSDGRASVHKDLERFCLESQRRVAAALRERGHSLTEAEATVWTNDGAVAQGRLLADARPDLVVINIPVWAFPHFTVLAAQQTTGPLALFSNLDPRYPGMVGMLAAGGALDQLGRIHARSTSAPTPVPRYAG